MFLYLFIVTLLITLGYSFMKKKYSFWKNKGVNGPAPVPIVGNFGSVIFMRESAQNLSKQIYLKYSHEKVVGLYRGFTPVLLINDPELIKQVTIKDLNFFLNRGTKVSNSPLSDHLFSAEGETWRILRQKLTPTFTSKKLKEMLPLINECIKNFVEHVEQSNEKNIDCEIRSLMAKYTLDMIASCAFGLKLDAYSDQRNVFREMANKVFAQTFASRLLLILNMVIPGIRKMIRLPSAIEIDNFFINLVKNIISERRGKTSLRHDFMDMMIELREQGRAKRKDETGEAEIEITDEVIAAQAIVFYLAGFETVSATMSFLLYELALQPDIQDQVFNEVIVVYKKYDGKVNYESVKEMTYLKMAFDETLRMYSVAGLLLRICTANYTFPGINLTIEKGTPILIPSAGLHSDPKYFANPDEFNPDNFSDENLKKIPHCVYMPFGMGPRNCIGMRFAEVQTMLGAAAFLKNFKVEPSISTKRKLEFDPSGLVVNPIGGIWLKITKR